MAIPLKIVNGQLTNFQPDDTLDFSGTLTSTDVVVASNSTTTPLGVLGTFTGAGVDTLGYHSITVHANVTYTGANGTTVIVVSFSDDNVIFTPVHSVTLLSVAPTAELSIPPTARYFRLEITNVSPSQATFQVQTILKPFAVCGVVKNQAPIASDMALVVRNIPSGSQVVTDSQVITDNAAFTDGASKVFAAGYILDETAGTALSENDAAAARVDSKRAQVLVIEDSGTRGQRASVSSFGAVKVDGSAVTQPISGTVVVSNPASGSVVVSNFPAIQPVSVATLPLPSGAATEDTLSAIRMSGTRIESLAVTENATLAAIKIDVDRIPAFPSTDRTTAAAPFSVELSDGGTFYTAAKTGQFPVTLGPKAGTDSLAVVLSPDQPAINVCSAGTLSVLNSTTTPLSAFSSFNGTFEDVSNTGAIVVAAIAAFDDTVNGLAEVNLKFSLDGINAQIYQSGFIAHNVAQTFIVPPGAKFFRVDVDNQDSDMTSLKLQTTYKCFAATPPMRDAFPDVTDVGVVTRNIPGGVQTVNGDKANNGSLPGSTNLGVLPAVATSSAPAYTSTAQVALSTDLSGNVRAVNPTQLPSSLGQKTGTNSVSVVLASDQGSVPVSGTVVVSNFPAVQPISAASLPLPSGAATEDTLSAIRMSGTRIEGILNTENSTLLGIQTNTADLSAIRMSGTRIESLDVTRNATLLGISGQLPATIGQKTGANSLSVVLASDQGTVPVSGTVVVSNFPDAQATSGSVVVTNFPATQPISAVSLPLPSGAATEDTLSAIRMSGTRIEGILNVENSTLSVIQTNTADLSAIRMSGTRIEGILNTENTTLSSIQTNTADLSAIRMSGTRVEGILNSQVVADNTAFTDGTTKLFAAGFVFDEVAGTALSENDAAAARVDSKRAVVGVIEDETTRGRRLTITAANAAKVDGSAVTQPVSAALLPLPTGAATEDTLSAIRMSGTRIEGILNAENSTLSSIQTNTADLSAIRMSGTRIEGILNAENSTLSSIQTNTADLSAIRMSGTRIEGIVATEATLAAIRMSGTRVEGILNAENTTLSSIQTNTADLSAIRMSGTRIEGIVATEATLAAIRMSGTRVEGILNAENSTLSSIQTNTADLSAIRMSGTRIEAIVATEATHSAIRMSGTRIEGLLNTGVTPAFNSGKTINRYVLSQVSTAGSLQINPAVVGSKHKVTGAVLTVSADATVQFAGSGVRPLTGAMDVARQGGFVIPQNSTFAWIETNTNEALSIITTGGGANGVICYITEP